jgi:hypothetical protein
MPPKKKKAAAPKKEEAVPALSEEERLVLAQAEALKVRGGRGRERLFSFRLALSTRNGARDDYRRLPARRTRAILADAVRSLFPTPFDAFGRHSNANESPKRVRVRFTGGRGTDRRERGSTRRLCGDAETRNVDDRPKTKN